MGPPEEDCENKATRVLVLPEPETESVDITVLFVCDICAVAWHGSFSERNEA